MRNIVRGGYLGKEGISTWLLKSKPQSNLHKPPTEEVSITIEPASSLTAFCAHPRTALHARARTRLHARTHARFFIFLATTLWSLAAVQEARLAHAVPLGTVQRWPSSSVVLAMTRRQAGVSEQALEVSTCTWYVRTRHDKIT